MLQSAISLPGGQPVQSRLPAFPPAQVGWLWRSDKKAEAPPEIQQLARSLRQVRAHVQGLLSRLSQGLEKALPEALGQAEEAWYQVGQLPLVDESLLTDLNEARAWLETQAGWTQQELAPLSALAAEALLTLRSAFGVATLVESQMATLIRLRKRMPDPRLMPTDRPFVDVAPAIAELARRWT